MHYAVGAAVVPQFHPGAIQKSKFIKKFVESEAKMWQ